MVGGDAVSPAAGVPVLSSEDARGVSSSTE